MSSDEFSHLESQIWSLTFFFFIGASTRRAPPPADSSHELSLTLSLTHKPLTLIGLSTSPAPPRALPRASDLRAARGLVSAALGAGRCRAS